MSFEEIFNPGARYLEDELQTEKILPVPVPVDRAFTGHLEDLGVTMPGLDSDPAFSPPPRQEGDE